MYFFYLNTSFTAICLFQKRSEKEIPLNKFLIFIAVFYYVKISVFLKEKLFN